MMGRSRRRTSGEIINATLLEVFLALVFIIFALAVFATAEAEEAKKGLSGALRPAEVAVLRARIAELEREVRLLRDSAAFWRARYMRQLRIAEATADTLGRVRFQSQHAPDCEPSAKPPWLITVRLDAPERLVVTVHRDAPGLRAGETFTVSQSEFLARTQELQQASQRAGCRYFARIQDTPGVSKDAYKRAMSTIVTVFRFREAFR